MSAIAQATTTLRIVGGAVMAPLRHPLLLAKELGTLDLLSQGRLVVLPSVSWHRDEYEALSVPFAERGRILDEQLEILAEAWGPYPIRHDGPRDVSRDVSELELVGGIRGRFRAADGTPIEVADVDEALADLPRRLGMGFRTICFKPAMFCRTVDEVPALCRHLITAGEAAVARVR